MFEKNNKEPVDSSINYNKTKREVINEKSKSRLSEKMLKDLKPMYELIGKINNRLDRLEEKFYIRYITDKYIEIEGNLIVGDKSELLSYLLDNLCKVACANMSMKQMNELSMMQVYYNSEKYNVPSIAMIEVEKIVHRMNELLAQTDCEVFDIDYYEKTLHKKIETYTKKDLKKEKKGIDRDQKYKYMVVCVVVLVLFMFFSMMR